MFATALGASVVGFGTMAEPVTYNATSFEGYTADTAVVGAGGGDVGESGVGVNYFYYDGDSDASLVKEFGDVVAPTITRPYYWVSSNNTQYLELSTEGGILWRSINQINTTDGVSLGDAQQVAATGTYLDTLVQFTPTEDGGAPELGSADKLAIWLNVDSNQQTNLQVRANLYDFGEAPSATATTFTLAPETGTKEIVAGQWYRLTVKATPNVMNTDENGIIPVFEIYIDGVQMCATTAQFSSAMAAMMSGMGAVSETMNAAITANKLFPSLATMGGQGDTVTLQGVGFKGSGALDDLVWTEVDPFQGGAGGDDYKVEIGGSDVIITPQAGDLAALQAAIVAGGGSLDVTDVAAVNAALAAPIPGTSPSIPSWQALFLGVAPTTNGLEQVAIESVTVEDGTVTVAMSDDLTLMTGRGVDIVLKVIGSDDLSIWDTANPLATATNTLTIPAITPAQGETKKFYKVVVEFAATPAQQN